MILSDMLLIAALGVFVIAWWVRPTPGRRWILLASALAAIIIGIYGYSDDRWQDLGGAFVGAVFLIGLGVVVLKNRLTRTDRTGGVPWLSGIPITIGLIATIALIREFPINPLPKPSGQYAVGVRTFEIDDASRPGIFAAKPDEPRRLLVRVWYPAGDVTGRQPAPYFNKAETASTAQSIGALVGFPPFFTYVRHVATNSYTDAPLLPNAANLPVVIYSHGYTSHLAQNTVLMEELASHGYIAYAIQHTYDSSATAFPNGDVAPTQSDLVETVADEADRPTQADAFGGDTLDKRLNSLLAFQEYSLKNGSRIAVQSTKVWMADRLFLHDTLQKAPPTNVAEIARAGNLTEVAELGMSFGGAIAGELCMYDTRCVVGVNMDGGNFPFSATNADEPVPFLMLHSDPSYLYRSYDIPVPATGPRSFNEFSYERIATAGARPDVYRISIRDTQHLGISDFSLFVGDTVKGAIFGDAPSAIMVGAQNDFILGFLDKHMRGKVSDYPTKELEKFGDAVVVIPNGDLAPWWNAKPEAERAALEARIIASKPTYPGMPILEPTKAAPIAPVTPTPN
jgi:predicted dienelactone hydrolase